MKYLLIVLFLIRGCCFGQKSIAEKFSYDGKDSFVVVYEYNDVAYMSPMVGRFIIDSAGNYTEDTAAYRKYRHYFANINVYKLTKRGRLLVGNQFFGYYTIDGCFEDSPEGWVQHAKDLQTVIDKNYELQKINGKNAIYKYIVTWDDFKVKYVNDEYGVDIKRISHKKMFKTNQEAHRFIDKELLEPILGGGVNIKFDSVLVKKQF